MRKAEVHPDRAIQLRKERLRKIGKAWDLYRSKRTPAAMKEYQETIRKITQSKEK